MTNISENITLQELGRRAKAASLTLAAAPAEQKNQALHQMAAALLNNQKEILAANQRDLQYAQKMGMNAGLLDRLELDEKRLREMSGGLLALCELPDPIGEEMTRWQAASGIEIVQKRVPLGVVGLIYEARPNVTSDAAGICLKTGNAVLLRGGSDALQSNQALTKALRQGVQAAGLPADAVQLLEDTSRQTASEMMRLNQYIDVLIPRGGAGLIKSVLQQATVPVIETGSGNCHIYVEATAQPQMAIDIVLNAKVQRPAVCNAAETLLIDAACAPQLLPQIAEALQQAGVELRGCPKARAILQSLPCQAATDEDWATEYGALTIACRVVQDYQEAVEHINRYNTRHSEAIITENPEAAAYFQQHVDAAAVYVNASTRFTDGFQFGFGAEIGISTQKLHARGPMALLAMTSYKYLINGAGQVRK